MRLPVLALVLTFLAPAVGALAQTGPLPRASDDVVLARVYRSSSAGTDPVGRLGLVVSGKGSTQALELVAADQSKVTLSLTVSRKGDGARVEWQLRGAGGEPGSGTTILPPGALSRVTLRKWTGGELFASMEAGRAGGFDAVRLSQHFGGVGWGTGSGAPSAETVGVAPVLMPSAGGGLSIVPASALLSAPSDRPKGPAIEVQCPGGRAFNLSLDSGRGECRAHYGADGGGILGATCADNEGNAAEASCSVDSARGACVRSAGNGSCKQRL